ncbi:type 2 isopentenyl-diphosphate Delta-isomerase [Enterococcus diestrammenae]|uniref:Isopentenyl-diphosphate delta-isomerase n=1 Tax=Enterococcus diestrammenae TaxID=1155073 RepID=A0ABV0F718_9ENTE|nr:type 2 isopentenyl-diphosphate Delta-isomerase [Enterococcus diestrammenae]KAF1295500.1 type 2 isopentenyl-diphosphate Delta-isomerase [Enterococcus diestrammenae]
MNRKDQHADLANAFFQAGPNDFDLIRLVHTGFPEMALAETDLTTEILDTKLTAPFFINAMTGGSDMTRELNHKLATVAKATGLMMATGSVSAALKDPTTADSFTIVRETYPEGFLVANIGAGSSVTDAQRAVDLFEANALQVHVNVPQELVMPEGDRDFRGWLSKIEAIIHHVSVPVIVKEVGFGMSRETVQDLVNIGASAIDVSGRGGTSFTQIENARRPQQELAYLQDFGQSTPESLLEALEVPQIFDLIASGGIRNAYDIYKALLLGARACGVSGKILHTVRNQGIEAGIQLVEGWKKQLRMLMTLTGQKNLVDLRHVPLVFSGSLLEWCENRSIDIRKYSLREPS